MVRLVCIILLAHLMAPCQAALAWDQETIEVDCAVDQKTVLATFAFRNTGSEAMDITEAKTSCGCTTAALEKQVYAPGEAGSLDVIFDIGSRSGRQQKTITVLARPASGGEPQRTVLTLVARIPEWLRLSNRSASWRIGDVAPQPKILRLSVLRDQPIEIVSATVRNDAFTVEVRVIEPGRLYELAIVPLQATSAVASTVEVTTSTEVEKFRILRIPVTVR